MSESHEIFSHKIERLDPEDPYTIFNSIGNLVGRAPTLQDARRIAKTNRIRECAKELYDLVSLRD